MALMETFQEDFEFGGRDSGKWNDPGDNHIVIGTSLNLRINSNTSATYYTLSSSATYDLTGSYAFAQLVDAGNQALVSLEVYPVHLASGANAVSVMVAANRVHARKKVSGTSSTVGTDIAYNASTMKWFRIRESGGTTHWEYATDPAGSWTSIASASNPITVTALNAEVVLGTWDTEASTTTAVFDNFNVLPGSLQLSWKGYTWNKRIHAGPPADNQTWSKNNVSGPDGNDYITLSLSNAGSAPVGCEIFSAQRGFGYGAYTVVVGTRLDNAHAAVGFGGMFTFDFTDPPAYREIDLHETRPYLGQSTKRLLRNHTWNNSGSREFITDDMAYPSDQVQTHRLIWKPNGLVFEAYTGEGTTGTRYSRVEHTTQLPVPGAERVHFNVFVDVTVSGHASATPIDVVVRDFDFTALVRTTASTRTTASSRGGAEARTAATARTALEVM